IPGVTTVVGSGGIHINAYLGDVAVSASAVIDASDALLANKVATSAASGGGFSGFSAYGLLDPAIVGAFVPGHTISVDGSDVASLFSKAALLSVPTLPNIPANATVSVSGADPTVSLAGAVQATNGIVAVPVMLDHPRPDGSTGMVEAHLALTYD